MNDPKKETCNLGCRLTKRLLGRILVDGEFISHHDLEAAVAQQRHTNEQLGEILVRLISFHTGHFKTHANCYTHVHRGLHY